MRISLWIEAMVVSPVEVVCGPGTAGRRRHPSNPPASILGETCDPLPPSAGHQESLDPATLGHVTITLNASVGARRTPRKPYHALGSKLMTTCARVRDALMTFGVAAALGLGVPAARADGNLNNVNHIIIVMQENHSYDNYFGVLGYVPNSPYHNSKRRRGCDATD